MGSRGDFQNWARSARERPIWIRILVAIAVALVGAVLMFVRTKGGDVAYKIAMAVVAVVAIAIAAPQFFTGDNTDPNDWSDEIKALRDKGSGRSGKSGDVEAL